MVKKASLLLFLVISLAFSYAFAQQSALNKDQVRSYYNDGNFEQAVQELKSFIKANETYSREDSIFVAKNFAVMYTANPEKRELGKYYMHALLKLMPAADLVDMYVSDEIDRIFDKVRKEFLAMHNQNQPPAPESSDSAAAPPAQTTAAAPPSPTPQTSPPEPEVSSTSDEPAQKPETSRGSESGGNRKLWIFGGVAGAAVVVAAIFLITGEEEEGKRVIRVE